MTVMIEDEGSLFGNAAVELLKCVELSPVLLNGGLGVLVSRLPRSKLGSH